MTRMDVIRNNKVYVGKFPVGPINLVSRAPIMKGGLVARQYDETLVHAADVI